MDDREVEKLAKRMEKVAKLEDDEVAEQMRLLTLTRRGRRFLWWLLEIGKTGQQPFAGDASWTAFNCGELNVGQQILAQLLTKAPEGYLSMLQERNDDGRRAAELLRQPDTGDGTGEDDGGTGGKPVWDDFSQGRTSL